MRGSPHLVNLVVELRVDFGNGFVFLVIEGFIQLVHLEVFAPFFGVGKHFGGFGEIEFASSQKAPARPENFGFSQRNL